MAVQLNHTIVHAHDAAASARFLADILDRPEPAPFSHFMVVQLDNDVSLDFLAVPDVRPQHYAFLVGESDFDAIFGRILERRLPYWADPFHRHAGQINTNDGGRGVYWEDPNGHNLEIITRPYGNGG
ncbi:VOC family protein [Micromonospora sp. NPDC007230]|uniref:VOC family protein n=1 Tax=Micromonospora sp. NPDC007230 TaxID=3364237 RepID=UPI003684E5AC